MSRVAGSRARCGCSRESKDTTSRYGGALLGYIIPLAKAVSQSQSVADMLLWSGVALVAQIVAYGISRLILPTLSADVDAGKVASGIFMAAMSVSIGLLNAAAMTE